MKTDRQQADERIVFELRNVGVSVASVYDLVNSKIPYPHAIPVLLKCLAEETEPAIKEGLVRALTVKDARGIAENALLDEFEKIPTDAAPNQQLLKWAIGNALSVVATEKTFERVAGLLRDRQHGKSREMLAIALANMKSPRVVDTLIELLNDDEVAGHALMALGKLNAQKARPFIEPFLNHAKTWVRKEASKALAKLG